MIKLDEDDKEMLKIVGISIMLVISLPMIVVMGFFSKEFRGEFNVFIESLTARIDRLEKELDEKISKLDKEIAELED